MPPRRRSGRAEQYKSASYRELLGRLGANARRARTARKWTQEEAAEHCGLALQHYQRIEGGKDNLTMTTVARLVDGLELDATRLFARLRRKSAQ